MVLLDAGPLVALATPEDQYHRSCLEALSDLPLPFVTTWPVLTEAAWLLSQSPKFIQSLIRSCSRGDLRIGELSAKSLGWIADFMARYANVPADLADASLMYIAEERKIETVFTVDRRDFNIYRTRGNRALKIIP